MKDIIKQVQLLVEKFHKDKSYYKNGSKYNEHNCRNEFIDPFLKLLGWDIENKQLKAPQYREVITENYTKETGRPDYSMTLNGVVKYHIEAKKPAVDICTDNGPAIQTRRYGWSSNLRLSVLTNFEYLYLYDTTIPPLDSDNTSVVAIKKYHYTEYCDKFNEILVLLSQQTIYNGEFDRNLDNKCFSVAEKGLHLPVDEYFLSSINKWRLNLGDYLYKTKGYSLEVLNDYIQEFINQIIFIRICEDRRLPLYHKLKEILSEKELIRELIELFKEADKKYNSGLFINSDIAFDLNNEIIKGIIEELYYPQSPYEFNMIQPNILGEIYEMFLAEHLILNEDKIELASKSKNLNRDVVTTPVEIVKYMVEKTLSDVFENKSPEEILKIKIADIACGSGIYLIEAYEYIISYVTKWYMENCKEHLISTDENLYKLPFDDKKKLLINCIYGIDIDNHAVEVAKFNLSLKLLEDETEPTLSGLNKVLPDLSKNIFHGNSLIDFNNINYSKLSEEDKEQIVPFNWMKVNEGGLFNVIIGNPPYVNTEDMKNLLNAKEVKVYKDKYKTSKGQFDKYFIFIEKAIEKVKDDGVICYIVPNKFTTIKAGESLRELLGSNKYVKEYIDFGAAQLFKNKTIYSAILTLQKSPQSIFNYVEVNSVDTWFAKQDEKQQLISTEILGGLPWALVVDEKEMATISNMYINSVPLKEEANIFNGIQTSAERPPIYWFDTSEIVDETEKHFTIKKEGQIFLIEKTILKKYFKPVRKNEKNLGSYDICTTDKFIIFPYDENGKLYNIEIMGTLYPNTMKYLEAHYDKLKPKQIDSKGTRDVPLATVDTWYQYGRDQALTAFNDKQKLIVGVLSKKAMYLYDKDNFVIASGGTAGYCAISRKKESKYELEYIQAYLTHPATEKLVSIIGSDFEGGYYSRGTSILEKIPFKVLDFDNTEHNKWYTEIVQNTRRVYAINDRIKDNILPRKTLNTLNDEKEYLIKCIECLIDKVYSI